MVTTPNYDLDIDTTLGGNNASDYIIPSQKAIKSYVDNSTGATVDQTYDGTSANAQSGVAIAGAGFLQVKGAITNSTTLTSLATGIYTVDGVTHAGFPNPSQAYYGVLIQYGGTYKPQLLVAGVPASNGLYYRRYLTGSSSFTSWGSIPTIDQTFGGTSVNAQSGVAIAGELTNYVDKTSTQYISGDKTFTNSSELSFQNSASIHCSSGCGRHDITDFWFRGQNTYFNYPRSITNEGDGIHIYKQGITQKTDFFIDGNKIFDATSGLVPFQRLNGVTDNNSYSSGLKFWSGTQAEYDAIVTKDNDTLYNVEDTTSPIVSILDSLYPVGAIYIGTMATCPLQTLGIGTWQLVAQDRVLQGAGSRGSVGTTINESLPALYMTNTGVLTADYGLTKTSGYKDRVMVTSANGQPHFEQPSTYQDGAPVQPDGYLVNIWERTA